MRRPDRIRVLHVGKFYAPVEGGIENVVQELVNGFRNDPEVESSVLVAQRRGAAAWDHVDGTPVRRVRSHGVLLGLPLAPRFALETAQRARHFDIVHVHVPNPLSFFCDWHRLAHAGTRLVVHHHSDIVRPAQRAVLRGIRRQERRFYDAASCVLVTSQRLLHHSETLAPFREKCRVLPLSIELANPRPLSAERRREVRAELGCGPEDTAVFFLGRLVYYKGVQDLLRAAANTRCKIWLGGAGPLRADLEALAGKLGVSSRVRFLGKIPSERLPEIFGAADVFCLPSNQASEAFGVVQLEAMSHGLPVINTALPTGVPEVSLDGVTGLTVSPHDPASLARALRRLEEDAALRQQFGAAALERVRLFSRENIVEKLRELYRDVVDEPIKEVSPSRLAAHGPAGVPSTLAVSKGEPSPCLAKSGSARFYSARSWSIFPHR